MGRGARFIAAWLAAALLLALWWRQELRTESLGDAPAYAAAYGDWAGELRGRR